MDAEQSALAKDLSVAAPICFVLVVTFLALAIRSIHSVLRSMMLTYLHGGLFWRRVLESFSGFHQDKTKSDYWYPFIIGWFELTAYAFCISSEWVTPIGAWIGLKTLAQWNIWQSDRATFNLFLIGNMLVLASAYFFVSPMISVR